MNKHSSKCFYSSVWQSSLHLLPLLLFLLNLFLSSFSSFLHLSFHFLSLLLYSSFPPFPSLSTLSLHLYLLLHLFLLFPPPPPSPSLSPLSSTSMSFSSSSLSPPPPPRQTRTLPKMHAVAQASICAIMSLAEPCQSEVSPPRYGTPPGGVRTKVGGRWG